MAHRYVLNDRSHFFVVHILSVIVTKLSMSYLTLRIPNERSYVRSYENRYRSIYVNS
jgi:hypothetical protein